MFRKLMSKLWADDRGFIVSTELLFVTVVLVIGLVAGWAALRNSVLSELETLGSAILSLNPSFVISGVTTPTTLEGTTGGGAAYTAAPLGSYTVTAGSATSLAPDASIVP